MDIAGTSVDDWLRGCPLLFADDAGATEMAGSARLVCDIGTMLSWGSSVGEASREGDSEV